MALISGATAAGSAAALKSLLDDVTELRTQLIALLAKLDLDAGITDVDYESVLTPAALTTTK
ncbi:hypothetical protein LCGC14_1641210 [marine sediment metagenome]|uniref:Uncharacterized protein n=1 Tax=marine sediment metagenome TaxID=412755 RepID=A0A0F9I072_9ZZZZ